MSSRQARVSSAHSAGAHSLSRATQRGVPIAITVWSTPAKATAGILAVTDHARAISDAAGKTFYYLTGANWLIDFDTQRRAPEQVKEAFGGNVQKIG